MSITQNTPDDFLAFFHAYRDMFLDLWMYMSPIKTHEVGAFRGSTLFRKDPFQVQVWNCPPGSSVPDHTHPNIDTIVLYLTGKTPDDFIYLRLDGKEFITRELIERSQSRGRAIRGRSFRIAPGRSHGFTTGKNGCSFIAFEKWTGPVTSAELDWDGPPIDQEHAQRLNEKA